VCVVVIRHAKRIRRIILLSVFCPALYFSTLFHKRYDLKKKIIEPEMCVLISLQFLSETFLILRRNRRGIVIRVYKRPCKVPAIIERF
jgi:hypothetical protein